MTAEHHPDDEGQAVDRLPLPPRAPVRHVLRLGREYNWDSARVIDDLYRELGPVFRLRATVFRRWTFIAGKTARSLLSEGIEQHLDRHEVFDEVAAPLGDVNFVLTQSGAEHKRLRRLLSIAYSRQVASPLVPELLELARAEVSRYPLDRPLRVKKTLESLVFELYCHVLTRRSFKDRFGAVSGAAERATVVVGGLLPKLALKDPLFRRRFAVCLKIGRDCLAAHKLGVDADGLAPDLLRTLMDLRDKDDRPMTDAEVVAYAV